MIQYHDHSKMDDAGDFYCVLGWGMARGKGRRWRITAVDRRFFLPVQERQYTGRA